MTAAATALAWVAIGAAGVAIAAFVLLALLILWSRRDAKPYWNE